LIDSHPILSDIDVYDECHFGSKSCEKCENGSPLWKRMRPNY